jgi:hypothetical protein
MSISFKSVVFTSPLQMRARTSSSHFSARFWVTYSAISLIRFAFVLKERPRGCLFYNLNWRKTVIKPPAPSHKARRTGSSA